MANIDEAFAALSDVQSVSVNENVDFVVDSYLRVISIPVRGVVLGVEGDKDVNRVTFRMSRTYKGVDMSQFQIRINYANANNELNYFKVTEITVSDDEIVFVWVVGADAVAYVGNVEFVVRFIKLSGSNIIQELNTTLATAKSLIGLSVDGEISPVQREDLLAHFYNEIDAYSETKKNEILDSIPEDYTALANEVDELKGDLLDITELFEPKLNLLNTVECKSNTWMNADGSIQYDDTYWITNFISVKSGQTVYFTNRTRQIKMRSIIVFDSDKKAVLNSITSGNELYAYTNNSDTKQYIVGNNNNNNMYDVMAIGTYNYDSTYIYPVLGYEEYILALKKDSNTAQEIAETAKANAETAKKELDGFVLNMRNVFDFNACLVNHWLYDRNDNPIVEFEGYTVTDYILVPPQKIIVFSEGVPYSRTALKLRKPAIIYDINKVKIGSYKDSDHFFYYYNNTDDYVYVRFNIQRTVDNYYMAELIDYTEEPVFSQIYYEFGKTFIDKSCVIDLMEDAENVGVRDFFKSEIDDTVSKILSLTDKPSYCMTFVTDTHYAPDDLANKRRTFDTLHNLKAVNKKIYSIGLSSTGDFVLGNQDQYTQTDIDAICNTVRMGYLDANPKVYMVNGNHDGIGGGVPRTSNYKSVMTHNEEYVVRDNDNPYFYVDHKKVKVRGIYLSTNTQIGDYHYWGMESNQIAWLKSVLDNIPTDFSVIIYSHIGIFSEQFINGKTEVQNLLNSFHNHNGDYTEKTGKCIAWFCGHEHFDWVCPSSQSGVDFPVIVTTASHLAGWNPPEGQYTGASAPSRSDGTVTQDAWDTIIYRPDEDKLYMVRFGAGEDREINLATWDKTQ